MVKLNKEYFKRVSTYLNIASAVGAGLLALQGVIPPEAMTYIVSANAIVAAAQSVTVKMVSIVQ